VARGGIVSPADHDQLVEIESLCEFCESRGHLICGADDCLAAELLGSNHLHGRIRALGFLGRHERQADALPAIDDGAFGGFETAAKGSSSLLALLEFFRALGRKLGFEYDRICAKI
jgi:hypothetical protein